MLSEIIQSAAPSQTAHHNLKGIPPHRCSRRLSLVLLPWLPKTRQPTRVGSFLDVELWRARAAMLLDVVSIWCKAPRPPGLRFIREPAQSPNHQVLS